jgi:hypothetical protein
MAIILFSKKTIASIFTFFIVFNLPVNGEPIVLAPEGESFSIVFPSDDTPPSQSIDDIDGVKVIDYQILSGSEEDCSGCTRDYHISYLNLPKATVSKLDLKMFVVNYLKSNNYNIKSTVEFKFMGRYKAIRAFGSGNDETTRAFHDSNGNVTSTNTNIGDKRYTRMEVILVDNRLYVIYGICGVENSTRSQGMDVFFSSFKVW